MSPEGEQHQEALNAALLRARKAANRGDWLEAVRCWEAVRALWPHHAPAYVGVGNALRQAHRYQEAELVLAEGSKLFPDDEHIAIARAGLADARSDWPAALSRWQAVKARWPHHAPAYVGAGNALREAQRYDEAELLLEQGVKLFPDDEHIAIALAWLANARSDWPCAVSRWEAVRARSPHYPAAYVGAGNALREAHRYEEAELLLNKGTELFPDDEHIAIARAWLANARSDWPAALSRWGAVRARWPHHAQVYVGAGNALREAQRYEEAELLLDEGAKLFPDDEHIAAARGWLANARSDWQAALSRWELVLARWPDHPPAYVGTGNALRGARRFDEAERVLGAGADRFPDHEEIAIARAWLANARSDWPAALRRWEAVRARSPHNLRCYWGNIQALRGAGRCDLADALIASAQTVLAATQDVSPPASSLRREFEAMQARIRDDHLQTLRRKSYVLLQDGKPEEAEIFNREALRLAPDDVDLLLQAVLISHRLQNIESKRRAFQSALAAASSPEDLDQVFRRTPALFEGWERTSTWMMLNSRLDELVRGGKLEQNAASMGLALRLKLALRDYEGFLAGLDELPSAENDPALSRLMETGKRLMAERFPDFQAPKVFGIGLSKTGTTSLTKALSMLGFLSAHYTNDLTHELLRMEDAFLFDALIDTPVCVMFEALYYMFPNAKFIYTVRDPDSWSASLIRHYKRYPRSSAFAELTNPMTTRHAATQGIAREIIHGVLYRHHSDALAAYRAYDKRVQDFFHSNDRSRLLVLDVQSGDGWEQLCRFVKQPVPPVPFPWENKSPQRDWGPAGVSIAR